MAQPVRLAVLASGGGTNLQALLDHFHQSDSPAARVELVIASRPGIGALARADAAGVPTAVLDAKALPDGGLGPRMLRLLREARVELVVLAGYLKLVPADVLAAFPDRILNIHPALLPSFGGQGMYGLRVHQAVLDAGATVTGATVHRVGERYDEGPIVAQWPVPVVAGDTAETLAARVLRVEHLLLPAAVEALATGRPPAGLPDDTAFELTTAAAPSDDSVRRLLR